MNENIIVLGNHPLPSRLDIYSLLKLWGATLLLLSSTIYLSANAPSDSNLTEEIERILKKSNQQSYFEKNIGQWHASFAGLAKVSNMTARFYEDKVSFIMESDDKQDVFVYNMRFLDVSKQQKLSFKNRKDGIKNYIGCVDEVPLFEEVLYENIYPNIDLRFYINAQKELEFDYIVLPGGDPNQIRYAFDGIESLAVGNEGFLSYCSPFGELKSSKPYTYQRDPKKIIEIETEYHLDQTEISFSIENYDSSRPLIIDPTVFEWSTYIGGTGVAMSTTDQFFQGDGFVYLCGIDQAVGNTYDYPTTPGSYPPDPASKDVVNIVVSKFDTLGNLKFSTYLPVDDTGTKTPKFAFDDNSVFFSFSLEDQLNFIPGISSTAYDPTRSTAQNEIVVGKLNSNGILDWTTYLGGSDAELLSGIAANDGNLVVFGVTLSQDFPVYQANYPSLNGTTDAFISKFNYDGTIQYSSFVGVPSSSFITTDPLVITKNGYTAISIYLRPGEDFDDITHPAPILLGTANSLLHIIYDANNDIQYSTQYNNESIRIADMDFDGNQLCILTKQTGDRGLTTTGAFIEFNGFGLNNLHVYCIDVPSASLNFATYNSPSSFFSTADLGKIQVENGFVYVGGLQEVQDPSSGTASKFLYLQKFNALGDLVYQNDFGFTAKRIQGLEVYNEEALIYVDADPTTDQFTATPDAAQINSLGSNRASYLLRTDVNGNYNYGTWISGTQKSEIYSAFLYNGSIYAFGLAMGGFPTTVGAFQTVNTPSPLFASATDFYVLKINDAMCIDDLAQENIIGPELIEVCINGTVPFIDGSILNVDPDSLPHYLIDNVPTPSDNNFVVSYQWQISFVGSSVWTDIAGATNPAYQPQPLDDDAEFRRIAILEYADCFHADTSNVSLVDVNLFHAPNLPPDTVYYKCAASTIGLDVTAAGGTPPYNYNWTPTAGLSDPTSPTPTTNTSESTIYNVEVTDANDCLFIEQFTVRVYEANAGDEMISCIGTGVQIGTPHIAPGVEGFEYVWTPSIGLSDPSSAQPIANPTDTVTYTLSITGPDRCTVTDDIFVEPIQTEANAGADVTICFGDTIQFGEPSDSDFDFIWSPSQYLNNNLLSMPTADPDEIPDENPITYFLTKIHKITGCTDFDSIQIYVNTASAGLDFCGPRTIGSADHSSGLATYQWTVISGDASSIAGQENDPTPFVAPNQPTLYQLDVTWNGVTCTDEVFVPNCGCLLPEAAADSDLNCEVGDVNFNTVVYGTSIDTSSYNYLWTPSTGIPDPTSPFLQNFTISLATPTNYTLTATLKANSSVQCSSSILLFPAPPLFPFAHAVDTITCMGEGVNIGGPTIAGWTASWTPNNGTLNQTSVFNPIASPTELTSYSVIIEEISSGCQIKDTAIVEVFDIIADAGPDDFYCENSIVQLGTPAIPGLVYSWEPKLGLANNDMAQTIDTIFATTIYYLTVSDSANTCSIVDTLVYTVVNNPVADAGNDAMICQGGLGIQIGTPAIAGNTYSWSPSIGLSNPNIAQPFANPNSTTTYTLTVGNNAQGCFSTDAITVTVANGEPVDAGTSATVCLNETIQIGSSPPESGYSYTWSPATGLDNPNIAQPTATVTQQITYTVTLTAPTGCVVQDTISLTPSEAIADAGEDINTCPNIDVILGSPALPGYTYSWSPTTGLDNANIAQPTLTASSDQVYSVTATNSINCEATDQVNITVQPLSVDAGPDRSICSSGVSIGTPAQGQDFSYIWSPSNTLNNATIAQPIASPTSETTYTVTITQISTGCTATDMVTVTPSAIAVAGADQVVCPGQSVLLGDPGLPGFTYTWSPTTGLDNPNIAQPTATVNISTTYTLTVSDGLCISSDEIELILSPEPIVSLSPFEALCLGACVQIGPTPNPSYRYSWSPVDGLSDPNIANPIACPNMTTIYTLFVTDLISGCLTEDMVSINVSNNTHPEPEAGPDIEICPNETTRIGSVNQSNNFAYSWSPTTYLTSPFSPASNVIIPQGAQGPFTYILTAIDIVSGCEGQDTVVINVNDNPIAPVIPNVQSCQNSIVNLCEDCIENPNYSYIWSPGTIVSDSTKLSVSLSVEQLTILELTIIDKITGCTNSTNVTVDVNNLTSPNADAGQDQNICLNETISIGQSNQGNTYTWYPEEYRPLLSNAFISNPTFSPSDTGVFTLRLEVENKDGCVSIDTTEISVLDNAIIDAGTSFFTCETTVTLSSSASANAGMWSLFSGPNTPFIFAPNDSITEVVGLIPGTYRFAWTVTSTEVCNTGSFDLVTVEVQEEPNVDAGPDLELCLNESQVIGQNDAGLTYTWFPESLRSFLSDPFVSNPTFNANAFGEFTFWVESENTAGCIHQDTVNIEVLGIVEVFTINDFSTCDTEITLNAISTDGDGMWLSLGGPSTPLIHSPNSHVSLATQLVPGEYLFSFVIDAPEFCNPNEADSLVVTIYETPIANAGPDFEICDDETATLGPIIGDYSFEWFPVNLRQHLSDPFIRNPIFTPPATGTFEFWTEVSNADGCIDLDTMEVQVSGYASITAQNPITTCRFETNLSATIVGGTGEWVFVNGPNLPVIDNPTDPLTNISSLIPGKYTLQWEIISEDVCNTGDFESISLEVLEPPASDIVVICGTTNNDASFTYTVSVEDNGANGTYNISGFDTHTGLAYGQVHGPFGPFPIDQASYELNISFDDNECEDIVQFLVPTCGTTDFGDLPDTNAGVGPSNYQTYSFNNGPSHTLLEGLRIATEVDSETEATPSVDALGDGNDEDAYPFLNGMDLIKEAIYILPVEILNTTGNTSYLEIWVDWNGDGDFMDLDELVYDENDNGSGIFTSATWNLTVPEHAIENQLIGMRMRLSLQDNMSPNGPLSTGEVEDYIFRVVTNDEICLPLLINIRN